MIFRLLFILLLCVTNVFGQSITGPQHSNAPLNVTDGSSSCYPYSLAVSSGTLSCSNGIATVTTGGGSGGSGSGTVTTSTIYQFAKYPSTGNTVNGSTSLYTDINNNIGIGTNNPHQLLEVNGNSILNGNVGIGTTDVSLAEVHVFSGAGDAGIRLRSIPTNTVPNISYYNSAGIKSAVLEYRNSGVSPASVLRIGSVDASSGVHFLAQNTPVMYFDLNQNIGIGSAAPGSLLDVNRAIRLVGTNAFNFANDGKVQIVASATVSPDLRFLTNGAETMRITSGANVGIGTTVPPNSLYVARTAEMEGFKLPLNPSSGYILTSNSLGVGTWMPAPAGGSGTPGGGLKAVQYNSPAGTFAGDETKFSFDGTNVGIGTTTPNNALDIVGGVGIAKTTGSAFATAVAAAGNVQIEGNMGIGTTLMSAAALTVMNGNVGIGTWIPGNSLIVQGGNVGIGTVNANNALQVVGNVSISGNSTFQGTTFTGVTGATNLVGSNSATLSGVTNIGTIAGGNGSSNSVIIEGTSANSPTAQSGITFRNTAGTGIAQTMYMDNGGNVGMGTVGPQVNKLNILGSVGIGTVFNGDTYLTTTLPIGTLVIEKNVGIGTVNPGTSLDVVGTIRASTGTANQAACWKADKSLGQCTSIVGAGGGCTCS